MISRISQMASNSQLFVTQCEGFIDVSLYDGDEVYWVYCSFGDFEEHRVVISDYVK